MKTETQHESESVNMARRSFLRYAGAGVAAVGVLSAASCQKSLMTTKALIQTWAITVVKLTSAPQATLPF
ncbi:twin-arginine translocation signal domain-containing protein [Mucilaginibacter antarcticus]|uniref:twin-arginine translocation signal domain-containing protein n=1 Tax=Mucilaginibacter antarcticus TaxID=1855725 RepID=UPI00362BABD2